MQAQMKQYSDFNQKSLASVQKLADINTQLMTNLAQQQMDMLGMWMESGNKQMQTLTQANKVQDVIEGESQLVGELSQKVLGNFRTTMDTLVDAKNQLTAWAEEEVKQVVELNPMVDMNPFSKFFNLEAFETAK
ncbi:phasin family protein [Candidatus Parabeggiatoa sp. HSG14]|uniref:phasin family protein n=1 Tax=Candidatus Parabeggiatoa sp. HSG14 TaxID=3055593 RepID=UPI0025A86CA4|nr:phasin family protein [Thiotrichales bacterium HSG14]